MTSARVAAESRRAGALRSPDESVIEGLRSRLRLVDRTTPERRRLGLIAAVVGVVVMLFAIAGAQTMIVSEQAHIDRVNTRIAEAETLSEQLRIELAQLQSPQSITTAATTRIGMIPSPTPVYLQPKATDDARAAEMPPVTPVTVPKTASPSASTSGQGSSTKSAEQTTGAPATAKR